MGRVLLGVTGSVAAIRTPQLFEALKQDGHEIKVVATQAALYFFDPAALDPADPAIPARNSSVVVLDEDEWPGRDDGRRFQLGEPVLHIELRRWAELFLIAPLDANTLGKLAGGLCDNCLTCTWRAWDSSRPIVLAPAMNTMMWQHPLTVRQLRQIALDLGGVSIPAKLSLDDAVERINQDCSGLRIIAPQSKLLACGDIGVGAMAAMGDIVAAVNLLLRSDQSHEWCL
jgi:phosphopantothenoylcysteine decarboxylase